MEKHKITYKTKDGTLKEQRFDDFNEFADAIEDAAFGYFADATNSPDMEISTAFNAYGLTHKESIKNGERIESQIEYIGE